MAPHTEGVCIFDLLFSAYSAVHAAAGEKKQRQGGGEVSGDQRGRPAEW